MIFESKISYEQDGKAVKEQYIIEHADLFGEIESKLYEEFGNLQNFSVVSIKTNNYTGSYRRTFELPADWNGQEVFFHVGSATES